MKTWIRRSLVAVAALAALAAGAVGTGTLLATQKMNRQVAVTAVPLALKSDAQTLERGRYLRYSALPVGGGQRGFERFVDAHDGDGDLRISRAEYPGAPELHTFVLGTDYIGRDILTRLLYGRACRSPSGSCRRSCRSSSACSTGRSRAMPAAGSTTS